MFRGHREAPSHLPPHDHTSAAWSQRHGDILGRRHLAILKVFWIKLRKGTRKMTEAGSCGVEGRVFLAFLIAGVSLPGVSTPGHGGWAVHQTVTCSRHKGLCRWWDPQTLLEPSFQWDLPLLNLFGCQRSLKNPRIPFLPRKCFLPTSPQLAPRTNLASLDFKQCFRNYESDDVCGRKKQRLGEKYKEEMKTASCFPTQPKSLLPLRWVFFQSLLGTVVWDSCSYMVMLFVLFWI